MRKLEQVVLLFDNTSVKENAQETFGSISVRNIETVLLIILFVFVLSGVYV